MEQEALIEAEGRIRSGKLAGRSLLSAILVVAIPVLFQQSMAATVGLFDKILAGRLPDRIVEPALDAIGIGSYVSWLVGIAMAGLGIGGQVIIARAMGSGDPKDAHDALGQSIEAATAGAGSSGDPGGGGGDRHEDLLFEIDDWDKWWDAQTPNQRS